MSSRKITDADCIEYIFKGVRQKTQAQQAVERIFVYTIEDIDKPRCIRQISEIVF